VYLAALLAFCGSHNKVPSGLVQRVFATLEETHLQIQTKWVKVMGNEIEHLVFDVGPHHMFAPYKDQINGSLKFVTRKVLDECSQVVEAQLTSMFLH
jgi:hypothetical protein